MQTESDYQDCALRLKALADPDRLQIVNALLRGGKNVTELAQELGMVLDKVSHHLGVLRATKLVTTRKSGRFIVYSLCPEIAARNSSKVETEKTLDLGCCQLVVLQPYRGEERRPRKRRRAGRRASRRG